MRNGYCARSVTIGLSESFSACPGSVRIPPLYRARLRYGIWRATRGTRTPDLYRVNLPRIQKRTTETVSNILSTILIPISQVEITDRKCRSCSISLIWRVVGDPQVGICSPFGGGSIRQSLHLYLIALYMHSSATVCI